MGLMTMATGRSRSITETIFENRFMHVQELARLGAHITLRGRRRSWTACPPEGRAGHGDRPARLGLAGDSPGWRREGETSSTASTISTAASSVSRRSSSRCGAGKVPVHSSSAMTTAITDALGVELGSRWTAIEAVGLYVPGGTASLSRPPC
jgi:hypothetical protein